MFRRLLSLRFVVSLGTALLATAAAANDSTDAAFERGYAQIVTQHCLNCHGAKKPKAGLDLTRRENVLEAGEAIPVVVAGKPDESLLLGRIAEGSMPPEDEGPALSPKEVAAVRAWIAAGAPWPKGRVLRAATTSPPPGSPTDSSPPR